MYVCAYLFNRWDLIYSINNFNNVCIPEKFSLSNIVGYLVFLKSESIKDFTT